MNDESSSPQSRGEALRRVQTGLRRLTHELHRLNDAVGSQIDLLPGDLEILDMIGRDGPMSPSEVTAVTGIHPATLTGMLDRLETGGWVSRQPDPEDRRRVLVEASVSRGGEVARIYGPMSKSITAICNDYSDDELAVLVDFLERASTAGTTAAAQLRDSGRSDV